MTFQKHIPYNGLPPLPPTNDLETTEVLRSLVVASRHLGELSGLVSNLADPSILINTLALQESKDSAEIENVIATNQDLYEVIAGSVNVSAATMEVLNGTEALYRGLELMIKRKHVISTSVLTEIVQVIKGNAAGIRNTPVGTLKNPVTGEPMFTPPESAPVIREKLSDLERFINDNNFSGLDPLVKMAVITYQFETIYPFTDGNGRTGRILNNLYLLQQGLLPQPVLYMSSYILKHKYRYYQSLSDVRENNNWETWILFYLSAVAETSRITSIKIKQLLHLKEKMRSELQQTLGASYSPDLLQLMFELPFLKIDLLDKKKLAHRQTASVWLKKLAAVGMLTEQKKGKTLYFINSRLIGILAS